MSARARSSVLATCVVAFVAFVAATAGAHGVGLSRGEYVAHDPHVSSHLVVARHEAALLAENSPSDAVVALALAQRTRVSRGGKPCTPEVESVLRTEADGLEVGIRHECTQAGTVSFSFDFVAALDPGHRHVAELREEGGTATRFVAYKGNAATTLALAERAAASRPALGFLWMGVEHILTGWDHLLFLLGVALLPWRLRRDEGQDRRARLRTLVLSVSAFTVAHSLTLTLGVLGITPLAPAWVEPLIALSIAAVGLEALFMKHAAAPYVTTFGFGLVHGMGFAGALAELSLSRHELPAALALFNLGVELGQLAALVPVVLALVLAARAPRVLPRLVPATGIALTLAGVALFGARVYDSLHEGDAEPRPPAPQALAVPAGSSAAAATAERVCAVVQDLPRTKRAECEGRPAGISLSAPCRTHLSRALADGAVTFEPAALAACLADVSSRYATCGFVAERSAARPATCSGVLVGTRAEGAPCRSSLECASGHICDGASALDPGICRKPREPGDACGMGIDTLAGYVHAVSGEETPECAGGAACVQNQCRPVEGARAKG